MWVDHAVNSIKEDEKEDNLEIKDVNQVLWKNQDLLDECTNYAMKSDILRLEIIFKYGGIYVDVDAKALRSFGPIFSQSFLSFRPANWTLTDPLFSKIQSNETKLGTAGTDNGIFGFPAESNFLRFSLAAVRENFPTQTATLYRTGPVFLKEVFLQYPYSYKIQLINWDYIGRRSEHSIIVDDPGNSDWDDTQDVRRKDAMLSQSDDVAVLSVS